jgi:uncharacterized membrane protein YhaH (DUF805 family)
MTPIDWALRPLKRYADYNGRAPRAEYWWYVLAMGIVGFLLGLADTIFLHGPIYANLGPLGLTFTLVMIIPGIAVLVRRLHDTDRSGWWALVKVLSYAFVFGGGTLARLADTYQQLPVSVLTMAIVAFFSWALAGLMVFIFVITEGTQGQNRYGPDPYGLDQLEEVFA